MTVALSLFWKPLWLCQYSYVRTWNQPILVELIRAVSNKLGVVRSVSFKIISKCVNREKIFAILKLLGSLFEAYRRRIGRATFSLWTDDLEELCAYFINFGCVSSFHFVEANFYSFGWDWSGVGWVSRCSRVLIHINSLFLPAFWRDRLFLLN